MGRAAWGLRPNKHAIKPSNLLRLLWMCDKFGQAENAAVRRALLASWRHVNDANNGCARNSLCPLA